MSYRNNRPDYVQSWFAMEWFLLLLKIFSYTAAICSVLVCFVLVSMFPDYGAQIILGYGGLVIVVAVIAFIYGLAKFFKRRPTYDPSTDNETSAYRWDAMHGGPVRDERYTYTPIVPQRREPIAPRYDWRE